jgi:twitching motility two-component system response regulator PilG
LAVSQARALVVLKEGINAAKTGNKVQARHLFRQAAELDPGNETTWLWLAGLAESPLESVHFLERVLALNPTHEKARTAIRAARVQAGIAAAKAQDKVQARLLLHKAVEHDPTNEITWMWLASVAENPEQGAGHLQKVLQINPQNQRARAGLERYQRQLAALTCEPAPPTVPAPAPEDQVRLDSVPMRNAESAPLAPQPSEKEVGTATGDEEVNRETTLEVDEDWECPFCQTSVPAMAEGCPACGAILTLDRFEAFFRPLHVDQEKINAAIERLEQGDPATDLATAWQLGLAYLNLKQFDVAIDLLQSAVELQGDGSDLAAGVEALMDYRAGLLQRREAVGKRKTILVVDDSPTIRKLVTMTLERRGFATRTAADGYEAVDAIRDWGVPDLILLDITMPGMDGYQLCRLLRQNADTTNIPIILLSGKDGFFSKVRGRMAGSTEYITKPFDPEGLLRVVERYCVPDTSSSSRKG